MSNDFNSNSRSGYRSKRKKTNLVLNGLIIVVLLLIIFVAYNIFASGNDKASPKKESPKTVEKETVHKDQETKENKKEDAVTDDNSSSDNVAEEEQNSEEASTPENSDESQAVVSEDGKTTENPSWKPVGTTQTGEHTPVYSGVDWEEMLNAISYATGIDKSNMTVFWLGRDQSKANASIGTISSKDKKQKYKVFIEWVDGEGWKPTKVINLDE
ncbi:YrrS family protein [Neobacillus soli]|uniref:YrrS family protein n=1 Tax=Neobacillus soli TaxID=220688 RepID=UPI000826435B|nr:YrrS family protein [Neobacillus soli]